MKLTSRQVALLVLLVKNEGVSRPLGEYASDLNVTARTLSGDLGSVAQFLADYRIELRRERGVGIRIVGGGRGMRDLLARLQDRNPYMTPESRREDILVRMLAHTDECVSVSKLADEHFVSRTSAANDLKEIEKRIAPYGLALDRTSNGTYLQGEESAMRKLLVDLLDAGSRSFGSLPSQRSGRGRLSVSALDSLLAVFPRENIEFIQQILDDLERSTDSVIGDPYYINLLTHLLICIDRVSQGHHVEEALEAPSIEEANLGAYVHAIDIRNRIEGKFDIRLSDAETAYIFEYLVSFGVGVGFSAFSDSEEGRLSLEIVDEIVGLVERYVGQALAVDGAVRNEMVFHVRSMLNRVRYGVGISNDYLPHLKRECPALFALMKAMCWAFMVDHGGGPVSDDEAAYLAMYGMTLLEASGRRLRVALVCQSGYGTSQFLCSRLVKGFPQFDVDVMSLRRFMGIDPAAYDFSVSTVRVDEPPVPTVFVSAMLDERDIDAIRKSGLAEAAHKSAKFGGACLPPFEVVGGREAADTFARIADENLYSVYKMQMASLSVVLATPHLVPNDCGMEKAPMAKYAVGGALPITPFSSRRRVRALR